MNRRQFFHMAPAVPVAASLTAKPATSRIMYLQDGTTLTKKTVNGIEVYVGDQVTINHCIFEDCYIMIKGEAVAIANCYFSISKLRQFSNRILNRLTSKYYAVISFRRPI